MIFETQTREVLISNCRQITTLRETIYRAFTYLFDIHLPRFQFNHIFAGFRGKPIDIKPRVGVFTYMYRFR